MALDRYFSEDPESVSATFSSFKIFQHTSHNVGIFAKRFARILLRLHQLQIISVVKRKKGQQLLEYLNAQHGQIKFTIEEESDGSLPFTDIRFSRDEYGQVVRQVYRKPTHTNRYVQFTSHHPTSVKSGVIDCLFQRATIVSSNDELFEKELDKNREAMEQNNHPKHFVEKSLFKRPSRKERDEEGCHFGKNRSQTLP